MTKIIAVSNQKGGVQKTTSVVNIAACMAEFGRNVLAVDLDPQANMTMHFGINEADIALSMYEVMLEDDVKIKDIIWNTKPARKGRLDIAPSTLMLSAAERQLVAKTFSEKILKRKLDNIKKNYDYILLDCPPSLGIMTFNALVASDEIIIPVDMGVFSLSGIRQLLGAIEEARQENIHLKIMGVLLGKVQKSASTVKDAVESFIYKNFKNQVFNTQIPLNVALVKAASASVPVIDFEPKSSGAIAYQSLTREILQWS